MEDIDQDLIDAQIAMPRPRTFRERGNPFDSLNDVQFRSRYRFSREGFFALLEELEDSISTSDRSHALLPAQRLALTLQSLASNSFQLVIGDLAGCSQPTVSRTIKMVCRAIAEKTDRFIQWPEGENLTENQKKFKKLTNIPGVVGAVDGTHVRIMAPVGSEHEHEYVNRKSYHSLNVGLACDFDLRFIWLCCRFGGSAHDSRVFRESAVHTGLQSGRLNGILLGDSAYRCEHFLYKPILNPATQPGSQYAIKHVIELPFYLKCSSNKGTTEKWKWCMQLYYRFYEKHYTDSLCRGRVRIENAIGCLKRQFHCLHGQLRYSPETAALITTAAVCLRNAAIALNERPFDDEIPDEDTDNFIDPDIPTASGQGAVQSVIEKYFT